MFDGSRPPAKQVLVGLEPAAVLSLASVKLPKSVASPVVAIVTYSIVSTTAGYAPPAKTARVVLDPPEFALCGAVKSPKSAAFPAVAIVI